MIIKNIQIDGFGKFHNQQLDFSPSINLVYGENEAGKSTMNHFLQGMLDEENNRSKYDKYKPWYGDQGFKGSMTLDVEDKNLLVQKDFGEEEFYSLYTLDGQEVNREDLDFALPVTSLTTYKLSNFVGKHLVSDLKRKISNKTVTNSENIDIGDIFRRMDEEVFSHQSKEEIQDIRDDLSKQNRWDKNLAKLYEELRLLYEQRSRLEHLLPELKENLLAISEQMEDENNEFSKIIADKVDNNNNIISEKELEVKSLNRFMDVELSEYEEYLEYQNQKERIEVKITELQASVNRLELETSDESIALKKGFRFLTQDDYVEDFSYELAQYKKIESSLNGLNDEINQRKEKLFGAHEVKDKYEDAFVLENDYQKVLMLDSKKGEKDKFEYSEEELISSKSKRLRNSIFAGIFSVLGIVLILTSTTIDEKLLYVLCIDVGIGSLFVAMYFGYVLYKLQGNISKLEYIKRYQEKNKSRRNTSKKSTSGAIDKILAKYDVEDVKGLESLFMLSKEAEFTKQVLEQEVSILDSKYIGYNNQKGLLKRRIERRMLQCEFSSDFENNTIQEIDQEFNQLLEAFNNIHSFASDLDHNKNSIEAKNLQLNEIEDKLSSKAYAIFHEYSYTEIFEFKQRCLSLKNDIELLNEDIERLNSNKNESKIYKKLSNLRSKVLEEELHTSLVLKTTVDQVVDNEKLIRSLRDKKRELSNKEKLVDVFLTKKTLVDRIKEIIETNVNEVHTALYPILNRMMNKTLLEITGRYEEIQIDDDGEIILNSVDGESVNIEDLSLGTIDQIYFTIGITMIEGIYDEHQSIPLILDDAFVQYDDDRFENVMNVIAKLNRQIIIFTCYEREYDYFKDKDVTFNYITLENEADKLMEGQHV